ncbi:MAG: hypothetical protein ACYTG7_15550 [Planctomycetota bacterium]|jgi:hypothetical protein
MDHQASIRFSGDPAKALETARSVLALNGFKVSSQGEGTILAEGPGLKSTRQNPLLGMTRAQITVRQSSIDLEAELGGVRFMQRFIVIFPPALVLFLALVFYLVPMKGETPSYLWLYMILPWIVIGPLIAKIMKRSTVKAIETLLHNMSASG